MISFASPLGQDYIFCTGRELALLLSTLELTVRNIKSEYAAYPIVLKAFVLCPSNRCSHVICSYEAQFLCRICSCESTRVEFISCEAYS